MKYVVYTALVLLSTVSFGLVGEEIKGWLKGIPKGILWVACLLVPKIHRRRLYDDWVADLEYELANKAERPITRLVFGICFAASLIRGSRQTARELKHGPDFTGSHAKPSRAIQQVPASMEMDPRFREDLRIRLMSEMQKRVEDPVKEFTSYDLIDSIPWADPSAVEDGQRWNSDGRPPPHDEYP